jgi:hypothetical protein
MLVDADMKYQIVRHTVGFEDGPVAVIRGPHMRTIVSIPSRLGRGHFDASVEEFMWLWPPRERWDLEVDLRKRTGGRIIREGVVVGQSQPRGFPGYGTWWLTDLPWIQLVRHDRLCSMTVVADEDQRVAVARRQPRPLGKTLEVVIRGADRQAHPAVLGVLMVGFLRSIRTSVVT